ncbi:MAG TPA: thioredoxin domain-containing protein [Balneolaceae bacterium]|nr:thioredoxin domain-containing protein [Balneolaceae bacterium]
MEKRSLKIGPQDNVKGHPFAPVQLIEYGDYECPYSRKGYHFVQMLLQKRVGQVYFAFRNFPLRNIHPHAEISAEAALAARQQGRFWEMHDLLFGNNRHLNEKNIFGFAEQINLDLDKFENDLKQHIFREQITSELKEGRKYGVQGTPTFFINEDFYEGELNYRALQDEIDGIL